MLTYPVSYCLLRNCPPQAAKNVAYVPQAPFVMSGTVLENVLMGRAYDQARFKQVVQMASLDKDIARFHDAELTEIGERGVTLSGNGAQSFFLLNIESTFSTQQTAKMLQFTVSSSSLITQVDNNNVWP